MPNRITENLHHFRTSIRGGIYFVTCCTTERQVGLTDVALRQAILESVARFALNGDAETFAITVMPDHVHWLLRLGARLTLGRVLARFKAETRIALAGHELEWQRDFFEHMLREKEDVEDYGLYIFLNPYRAALIDPAEKWPAWHCPPPASFGFIRQLNEDGTPPREWIGLPVPAGLMIGE